MRPQDPEWTELGERAAGHLEALLRLDTTNPPGNERLVADYVATALRAVGLEPRVLAKVKGRDNVVARLAGTGRRRPLMLASHADVVPAEPEQWTHAPFSGARADGCIWGRGALDMKDATAMHLAIVESLVASEARLERDLVVAVVADEEAGMEAGSRFLVDEHPDLVRAEHVIGELGGFTVHTMGLQVCPVQVAEKGICWIRARAKGSSGHGSVPTRDNAVTTLARGIARIGSERLPLHVCHPVREYLRRLADALPTPQRRAVALLANERVGGLVLDHLVRDPRLQSPLRAMLTNTATPTMLSAGAKVNVIPSEATAEIDGRTVPGQGPTDLLAELAAIAPELELEVTRAEPSTQASWTTPVFAAIDRVMARLAPEVTVVPYLMPGYTDAKSWSLLGASCYGFVPLALPEAFPPFFALVHGHDERVPIEALSFGVRALHEVVVEVCT